MAAAERSQLRIKDLHTLGTARTFFDGHSGTQNFASYMGTAGSLRMENRLIDIVVFAFVLFFIVPLVISAVLYALGDRVGGRQIDRALAFSRLSAQIRAQSCASFRHAPFAGAASSQLIAGSS
jgi:hypothetical protein